ncbi:hypothetical protein BESB_048820 [Besnoitia besnoiti]|uniref:Peptidase M14 domain-containing protein n=1 Tax=Besnoitia besnoiti TaxID=94643 RepID=A0A2A9MMB1_BESBE|nr:hypothetical protein BESB_048820 [Besnoitia besnoiti]PFH36690.1 hypothetical protein BESB_048820 [Besnoitia besnoiti]
MGGLADRERGEGDDQTDGDSARPVAPSLGFQGGALGVSAGGDKVPSAPSRRPSSPQGPCASPSLYQSAPSFFPASSFPESAADDPFDSASPSCGSPQASLRSPFSSTAPGSRTSRPISSQASTVALPHCLSPSSSPQKPPEGARGGAVPGFLVEATGYRYLLGGILVYHDECETVPRQPKHGSAPEVVTPPLPAAARHVSQRGVPFHARSSPPAQLTCHESSAGSVPSAGAGARLATSEKQDECPPSRLRGAGWGRPGGGCCCCRGCLWGASRNGSRSAGRHPAALDLSLPASGSPWPRVAGIGDASPSPERAAVSPHAGGAIAPVKAPDRETAGAPRGDGGDALEPSGTLSSVVDEGREHDLPRRPSGPDAPEADPPAIATDGLPLHGSPGFHFSRKRARSPSSCLCCANAALFASRYGRQAPSVPWGLAAALSRTGAMGSSADSKRSHRAAEPAPPKARSARPGWSCCVCCYAGSATRDYLNVLPAYARPQTLDELPLSLPRHAEPWRASHVLQLDYACAGRVHTSAPLTGVPTPPETRSRDVVSATEKPTISCSSEPPRRPSRLHSSRRGDERGGGGWEGAGAGEGVRHIRDRPSVWEQDTPSSVFGIPYRARCCMSELLGRQGKVVTVPPDALVFDSRFESGNLKLAVQNAHQKAEYLLLLRPDANAGAVKTSWFFFSVSMQAHHNAALPFTATFKIANLVKSDSLFAHGMRPLTFSVAEQRDNGAAVWRRLGENVKYYRNWYLKGTDIAGAGIRSSLSAAVPFASYLQCAGAPPALTASTGRRGSPSPGSLAPGVGAGLLQRSGSVGVGVAPSTPTPEAGGPGAGRGPSETGAATHGGAGTRFSTLEFTFTFKRPNDTVYFASGCLYTYSHLLDVLQCIQSQPAAARDALCTTPGGLTCPVLCITNPLPDSLSGSSIRFSPPAPSLGRRRDGRLSPSRLWRAASECGPGRSGAQTSAAATRQRPPGRQRWRALDGDPRSLCFDGRKQGLDYHVAASLLHRGCSPRARRSRASLSVRAEDPVEAAPRRGTADGVEQANTCPFLHLQAHGDVDGSEPRLALATPAPDSRRSLLDALSPSPPADYPWERAREAPLSPRSALSSPLGRPLKLSERCSLCSLRFDAAPSEAGCAGQASRRGGDRRAGATGEPGAQLQWERPSPTGLGSRATERDASEPEANWSPSASEARGCGCAGGTALERESTAEDAEEAEAAGGDQEAPTGGICLGYRENEPEPRQGQASEKRLAAEAPDTRVPQRLRAAHTPRKEANPEAGISALPGEQGRCHSPFSSFASPGRAASFSCSAALSPTRASCMRSSSSSPRGSPAGVPQASSLSTTREPAGAGSLRASLSSPPACAVRLWSPRAECASVVCGSRERPATESRAPPPPSLPSSRSRLASCLPCASLRGRASSLCSSAPASYRLRSSAPVSSSFLPSSPSSTRVHPSPPAPAARAQAAAEASSPRPRRAPLPREVPLCASCRRPLVAPWCRPVLFVSARVHPGESGASWVLQGLLSFLLGPEPRAAALREHFRVFVVPMLNPDGVVAGNSRCALSGQDLNRVWREPDARTHPAIFCAKALLHQAQLDSRALLFLDLHSHSTKLDVFMYCNAEEQPVEPSAGAPGRLTSGLLPALLESRCPWFCRSESSFRMERSKEGAGRVVCGRELGIVCSYTLEASVFGPALSTTWPLAPNSPASGDCWSASDGFSSVRPGLSREQISRNAFAAFPSSSASAAGAAGVPSTAAESLRPRGQSTSPPSSQPLSAVPGSSETLQASSAELSGAEGRLGTAAFSAALTDPAGVGPCPSVSRASRGRRSASDEAAAGAAAGAPSVSSSPASASTASSAGASRLDPGSREKRASSGGPKAARRRRAGRGASLLPPATLSESDASPTQERKPRPTGAASGEGGAGPRPPRRTRGREEGKRVRRRSAASSAGGGLDVPSAGTESRGEQRLASESDCEGRDGRRNAPAAAGLSPGIVEEPEESAAGQRAPCFSGRRRDAHSAARAGVARGPQVAHFVATVARRERTPKSPSREAPGAASRSRAPAGDRIAARDRTNESMDRGLGAGADLGARQPPPASSGGASWFTAAGCAPAVSSVHTPGSELPGGGSGGVSGSPAGVSGVGSRAATRHFEPNDLQLTGYLLGLSLYDCFTVIEQEAPQLLLPPPPQEARGAAVDAATQTSLVSSDEATEGGKTSREREAQRRKKLVRAPGTSAGGEQEAAAQLAGGSGEDAEHDLNREQPQAEGACVKALHAQREGRTSADLESEAPRPADAEAQEAPEQAEAGASQDKIKECPESERTAMSLAALSFDADKGGGSGSVSSTRGDDDTGVIGGTLKPARTRSLNPWRAAPERVEKLASFASQPTAQPFSSPAPSSLPSAPAPVSSAILSALRFLHDQPLGGVPVSAATDGLFAASPRPLSAPQDAYLTGGGVSRHPSTFARSDSRLLVSGCSGKRREGMRAGGKRSCEARGAPGPQSWQPEGDATQDCLPVSRSVKRRPASSGVAASVPKVARKRHEASQPAAAGRAAAGAAGAPLGYMEAGGASTEASMPCSAQRSGRRISSANRGGEMQKARKRNGALRSSLHALDSLTAAVASLFSPSGYGSAGALPETASAAASASFYAQASASTQTHSAGTLSCAVKHLDRQQPEAGSWGRAEDIQGLPQERHALVPSKRQATGTKEALLASRHRMGHTAVSPHLRLLLEQSSQAPAALCREDGSHGDAAPVRGTRVEAASCPGEGEAVVAYRSASRSVEDGVPPDETSPGARFRFPSSSSVPGVHRGRRVSLGDGAFEFWQPAPSNAAFSAFSDSGADASPGLAGRAGGFGGDGSGRASSTRHTGSVSPVVSAGCVSASPSLSIFRSSGSFSALSPASLIRSPPAAGGRTRGTKGKHVRGDRAAAGRGEELSWPPVGTTLAFSSNSRCSSTVEPSQQKRGKCHQTMRSRESSSLSLSGSPLARRPSSQRSPPTAVGGDTLGLQAGRTPRWSESPATQNSVAREYGARDAGDCVGLPFVALRRDGSGKQVTDDAGLFFATGKGIFEAPKPPCVLAKAVSAPSSFSAGLKQKEEAAASGHKTRDEAPLDYHAWMTKSASVGRDQKFGRGRRCVGLTRELAKKGEAGRRRPPVARSAPADHVKEVKRRTPSSASASLAAHSERCTREQRNQVHPEETSRGHSDPCPRASLFSVAD